MSDPTLPPYFMFIDPLLRVLVQHPEGVYAKAAREMVADRMELTPEQRALMLPSGKGAVYRNRCGWAHDRLKRGGYSASAQRGFWKITCSGMALAHEHPHGLPEELVQEMHRTAVDTRLSPALKHEDTGLPSPKQSTAESAATPDEQLDQALASIHDSVRADLMELISSVDPGRFEQIVLDVLHAMGYGASRERITHTPLSRDGGIDGVISLDRLGLEKVYVQAKRWQDTVGRPQIQAFVGALTGLNATKGVFITASSFSREAADYAGQVSHSIVLVDGQQLADFMIEHEVGVSASIRRVPSVDSDYFEDS